MPKPAASYARLSRTNDASEPNTDFQHKRNVEYLTTLGYRVAGSARYTEPIGLRSGRHLKRRPQMQSLLRDLPNYHAVAFFDFSRFSRSTEFVFEFLRAAHAHNVKVFNTSTRQQITIDNASEFLVTTTQAMFAEYESRKGSERMQNAYRRARENNWISHRRAGLGLRVVGSLENRHFEKDPATFKIVQEIFRLTASGITPHEVAVKLRARGLRAKTWNGQPVALEEYHVRKVLHNARWYRDFIAPQTIDAAVRRFAERRNKTGPAKPKHYPPRILSRILVCAVCGRPFHPVYDKTKAGNCYPSYRHVGGYLCQNNHRVAARKLEEQVFEVLERLAERLSPSQIDAIAAGREKADRSDDTSARRAELSRRLAEAKHKLLDDFQLAEEYAEVKEQIEKELSEIDAQDRRLPAPNLSPSEIKALIKNADNWRDMATRAPDEFGIMLRDLFARIELNTDNTLRLVPHNSMKPYFRGVL